jgi:hypothetical protein
MFELAGLVLVMQNAHLASSSPLSAKLINDAICCQRFISHKSDIHSQLSKAGAD